VPTYYCPLTGLRVLDYGPNVSVITVSKALRNHSDISHATRARVLKRVAEVNYRPNLTARALVTGRTHLIGLVVPSLVHSFFAEVAQGLSRILRGNGFSVMISSSDEDPELERQAIDHLLAREVDALLLASVRSDTDTIRRLAEQKTPCILVDRRLDGIPTHFVGVEDEKVGALATEHLIQIGCRTIAHICGTNISTALGRVEGYHQALRAHGIPINPDYIVKVNKLDESADVEGYHAARKLLELTPRPDGIFCFNDPVAIGAMKAILEQGFRIPQDVALIGAGNLHFNNSLRVPLSSIDQKSELIGERAARMAIKLVDSKALPPKAVFLTPTLVVRDSTRR
jgi:LacI family transcriptional regulator, galactose operon repressor